jgi:hypothetical protein
MFTASLPNNRRPIAPCVCLVQTAQKTQFPLYCCHVLGGGGGGYRPSHRNDSSSLVARIRGRENVYGHSSSVIETAHMPQYLELSQSNPIQYSQILTLTHATLFCRYLARNFFPSGYLTNISYACRILTYLIHWFNRHNNIWVHIVTRISSLWDVLHSF